MTLQISLRMMDTVLLADQEPLAMDIMKVVL